MLTNCSFNHLHVPDLVAVAKHLPYLLLQHLLASIIGIISLVVHYQLVVNKVEAVRAGLVRIFNHQTNCKSGKGGKKSKELCFSLPHRVSGRKLCIPSKISQRFRVYSARIIRSEHKEAVLDSWGDHRGPQTEHDLHFNVRMQSTLHHGLVCHLQPGSSAKIPGKCVHPLPNMDPTNLFTQCSQLTKVSPGLWSVDYL